MITELEQEFYNTFGIEPATVEEYGAYYWHDTIEINGKRYAPINERILLSLCQILMCHVICVYTETMDDFKQNILIYFVKNPQYFDKKQIQQLFKECK